MKKVENVFDIVGMIDQKNATKKQYCWIDSRFADRKRLFDRKRYSCIEVEFHIILIDIIRYE
jgi:hypothetical protein